MEEVKKQNLVYFLIFAVALAVIVANRCLVGFGNIIWLADLGSIFGILYVIYGAKHSILMHVFNFFSTMFIAVTNFIQRVYFSAFFAALIAIPLIVWGFFKWRSNEKVDYTKNVQKLTKRGYVISALIFAVALPVIIVVLWKLNTNLFYLDALYASFCFVGLVLSSHMYIEQFFTFLIADIFQFSLYLMLTIQNINNLSYLLMTCVFIAFNIISIVNWVKIYGEQHKETNEELIEEEKVQEES